MKSFLVSFCLWANICFAGNPPPLRFSDGTGSPSLVVKNYQYQIKEKDLGVQFLLSKEDAAKLITVSRRNLGKKLSLAVGGSVVSTARLLDVIQGNRLWLTFPDSQSLNEMATALRH